MDKVLKRYILVKLLSVNLSVKKKVESRTIASIEIVVLKYVMKTLGGGGGTWVIFCWICAADFSEPLPHFNLFCGQL